MADNIVFKPMLFSDNMVRALIAGKKTQTCRPMKQQPQHFEQMVWNSHSGKMRAIEYVKGKTVDYTVLNEIAPVQVNDVIYGREAWQMHGVFTDICRIVYRASIGHHSWTQSVEDFAAIYAQKHGLPAKSYQQFGWKPSIHMPAFASRIFLKVTNVTLWHMPNITEEMAQADGFASASKFIEYWKKQYGSKRNWAWVITFEKIERPECFLEHLTVYEN